SSGFFFLIHLTKPTSPPQPAALRGSHQEVTYVTAIQYSVRGWEGRKEFGHRGMSGWREGLAGETPVASRAGAASSGPRRELGAAVCGLTDHAILSKPVECDRTTLFPGWWASRAGLVKPTNLSPMTLTPDSPK